MGTPFKISGPKDRKGLDELIAMIKQKRGSPEEWLTKEVSLSKVLCTLDEKERVLAKGEYHTDEFHTPSVLTYNSNTDKVQALIFNLEGILERKEPRGFFSTIPYTSIAREVFDKTNTL